MPAPASPLHERWLGLVAATLKQDDAHAALAKLRTTTYDDITIEPLYTADDAVDEQSIGRPGHAPFVRGARVDADPSGWDVRQRVDAAAAGRALEELEHGATSVWLDVDRLPTVEPATIGAALEGVLLDLAPIVLDAGSRWPEAAEALAAMWAQSGTTPAPGGSLGADPFGEWASDRSRDLAAHLARAGEWAQRLATIAPGVKAVSVDGTRYHDAGGSDAQELGLAVAAAVATLRSLADHGVGDPFAAIELRLAATPDQFATIAKLRAARRLWARVAEVCGQSSAAAALTIHAVTSRAAMTAYDPAVNMLRASVECFAAGIAGADAITVLPYDAMSATESTELARRLARNTQSVLALESHLGRVLDPAGGSWYVEQLTAQLAEAAWAIVQEVEAAGGFEAAVVSGFIGERIAAVRARRDADIDHRRAPITGSTEFPNIAEPLPASVSTAAPAAPGSLPSHRWAERFEALRRRVDASAIITGRRECVYLATLGTPADYTARATFAKNFFEVAGLDTAIGPVDRFGDSGAGVVCLCSSNPVYAEQADDATATLDAAGARHIYVAGRDTVVLGGDAYTALADLLAILEIA